MTRKTFALVLALPAAAVAAGDRVEIGVSGFSEAVRNEKGVRDLKELGADYASGIPWKDRATLDLFAKYGLKAVVNGLPGWWGGKTEWAGQMAERRPLAVFAKKAADWQDHPAIRSVVIGDEPSKLDFAHYGKVFELVREKMPGAKPCVTIFPDYGSHIARGDAEARQQLSAASYEDYVRSFCELVPTAECLDMDFYPYSAPAETRASYFLRRYRDMAIVARAARDYGKQIGFYVQANSVFKELSMDLPKLRYMAYTDLAFGADALKFTCYTPSWWENNILTKEGEKTPRYDMVKTLIAEIRAFDREYRRFRCTGTRFVGFPADELAAIGDAADVRWYDSTALRELAAADGGRLVVGEFRSRRGDGETALLVASADDPEGTNVHMRAVTFRGPDGVKAWNREGPVAPTRNANGSYTLALPSDGVLFVTAPEPENPLKPRTNADDQIRRMSPPSMELRREIVALGFNNFSVGGARYDFTADPEVPDAVAADVKKMLRDSTEAGVDAVVSIGWPRDKKFSAKYPRLDRDGKVVKGRTEKSAVELDAAHPEAQRVFGAAAFSFAKKLADSPDFAGFRPFGEIRLRDEPSFTDYNAAAYKADTGRDVPPEAKGRAAPSWKTLKDLPANRVVSEHYPLLAFYRWFWQKGDGWNRLDEIAVDAFADATGGRRTFTEYEPCLRIPPLLGIAGAVSHIGNWIYSYDDPVNCDYPIAKSFATARGTPGQQVLTGLQLITHRERIAGPNGEVAEELAPAWTKKYPNCGYPNMPADMLRIGLWTCFARQHEGASFHSWQCLFDGEKHGVDPKGKGYQFTDPDLVKGLEKFFHEVAEPLGPLFRAVPERPMQVAVFESWASAILSGTAPAFWELAPLGCGVAATAANLMPGCLFEEEVQRDGVPESVKALLLPMCAVLTESSFVKLRAFQRRGGKLIAADDLAPALKADAPLPPNPKTLKVKAAQKDADFRAQAAALRATVERFCEPAVGSDNPFVHVHARGEQAYDLLFAVNDRRGPGPYVGVYERVLDKGLPTEGTITLKRDAKAVYDLVKHAPVTDFTVWNGTLSIPLKLDAADGRVFLVCDRPLAPLAVSVDGGKVTVTSPDKDVMIPIQVQAEGMKPYAGVVKNGVWSHDFGAARAYRVLNLATGK